MTCPDASDTSTPSLSSPPAACPASPGQKAVRQTGLQGEAPGTKLHPTGFPRAPPWAQGHMGEQGAGWAGGRPGSLAAPAQARPMPGPRQCGAPSRPEPGQDWPWARPASPALPSGALRQCPGPPARQALDGPQSSLPSRKAGGSPRPQPRPGGCTPAWGVCSHPGGPAGLVFPRPRGRWALEPPLGCSQSPGRPRRSSSHSPDRPQPPRSHRPSSGPSAGPARRD